MSENEVNSENSEKVDLFLKNYSRSVPEVNHTEEEVHKMVETIFFQSVFLSQAGTENLPSKNSVSNIIKSKDFFTKLIHKPSFTPILAAAVVLLAVSISTYLFVFKQSPTKTSVDISQSTTQSSQFQTDKDKTSTLNPKTSSKFKKPSIIKSVIKITRKHLDNMFLASLSRSVTSMPENVVEENDSTRLLKAFKISSDVLSDNKINIAYSSNNSIKTGWLLLKNKDNTYIHSRLIIEKDTTKGLQLFFIKEDKQVGKGENQNIADTINVDFFEIIKQIKIRFYE